MQKQLQQKRSTGHGSAVLATCSAIIKLESLLRLCVVCYKALRFLTFIANQRHLLAIDRALLLR